MNNTSVMEEDWRLLASFFPDNWRKIARETSALKGLRQDKSEEKFLRTLLMHLACGYSLRETAVRAREARLADLSDVALLKRLRKSKEWLYELCRRLFAERELSATGSSGLPLRLIDATVVKEPGPTGSLWRVHYSLQWPSLRCSFFKLTATEGEGTGESLGHFPVKAGEYLLADRGYCRATSIHHVAARGAYLTVRLNPDTVRIVNGQAAGLAWVSESRAQDQRSGLLAGHDSRIGKSNSADTGPDLCGAKNLCRHGKSQKQTAPQGQQERHGTSIRNVGLRGICDGVHDLPPQEFFRATGSGILSSALADRTGVQAFQATGQPGTSTKA
jgi:hypothetical protein